MVTVFAARAAGAAAAAATTRRSAMTRVAVIAHAGKSIGGGLDELRSTLERAGVNDPLWSEVPKSKYAPERVERVLEDGAELVFVWGGDGMVQRSVDALAGSGATLAIIPAGTANLFASSLEIPSSSRRQSTSASTAAIGSSTSARSTASASPSWPARASTRS